MALEPITRQEQIIAGKGIEPITRMERFLKEYRGGSGGGVQSNWNQNDPAAPDYVKNRTHWTDDPVETVLFEKTSNDFNELGYVELYFVVDQIEVGKEYTVSVFGQTYHCVAYALGDGSAVGLGSPSVIEDGYPAENEEFFAFFTVPEQNYSCLKISIDYLFDNSPELLDLEEFTFAISGDVAVPHPIDPKYLPDATETDKGVLSKPQIKQLVINKMQSFSITTPPTYRELIEYLSMSALPIIGSKFYGSSRGNHMVVLDWFTSGNGDGFLSVEMNVVCTGFVYVPVCTVVVKFPLNSEDGVDDDAVAQHIIHQAPDHIAVMSTSGKLVALSVDDSGDITTKELKEMY